jgi:hypothetical protein
MSSRGLSLVGFMDRLQAIAHLRFGCVPVDPSDAALSKEWQDAVTRLQSVKVQRAGNPDVKQIPGSDQSYIQDFVKEPLVSTALQMYRTPYQFLLIEIDPLLAFQHTVNLDRVDHHFRSVPSTVGTSDLMPVCLPIVQPDENFYHSLVLQNSQSVAIRSRNTGLRQTIAGIFPMEQNGYKLWMGGMQFAFSLPFVQVVNLNGRFYLSNGFHRVIGARKAGATHVRVCTARFTSRTL